MANLMHFLIQTISSNRRRNVEKYSILMLNELNDREIKQKQKQKERKHWQIDKEMESERGENKSGKPYSKKKKIFRNENGMRE